MQTPLTRRALARLLIGQSVGVLVLLSVAGLAAHSTFGRLDPDVARSFDIGMGILLASVVTLFVVTGAMLSRRLAAPLEALEIDLQTKLERMKLEREEQATLMAAISDAIIAVDRDGVPLFYNSRSELLFSKQAQARKLPDLFPQPEIQSAFEGTLRSGTPSLVKAIRFELETGPQFYSLSISPLRRGKREIYGAVGVFHDVSDLKLAEQIRIDFVANVSHELRTPLTSIKGYIETMITDAANGSPVDGQFLQVIKRNSDRLLALMNDLLDLSSIESGGESAEVIHATPTSTAETTERVLQSMRNVFEKKGQEVTVSAEGAPTVLADPKRLEQVLVNLLDNANKFTPVQGRMAVQWTQQTEGGNRFVVLKVSDSGPGIPPQHQQRLFERFYRIDKARSREQGGTGLGLAIVKHIMQRHGGSVWVESPPGQGATFICRFPV